MLIGHECTQWTNFWPSITPTNGSRPEQSSSGRMKRIPQKLISEQIQCSSGRTFHLLKYVFSKSSVAHLLNGPRQTFVSHCD
ncbi:hypothetical protein CEXT_760901 [Caerostris extrusa]|uniref:Uncharacterized protein n=1 Tax=Caerostris extrusa TaxID=172846 RepID=A0AAV4XJX7_CAEEX|nr:hypothetical protein CEXT_760901 [Caerostris extrusa]